MMRRNRSHKMVYISTLVLGIQYLLSALGKYSGLESFESVVTKFGFGSFFAYVIIGFESLLCICFLRQVFLRQASLLSVVFLFSLTLIYTYGYFRLDIESCGCFGDLDFLNTSNYTVFLVKNIVLLLLSVYVFKSAAKFSSSLSNRIISVILACVFVFVSIKYNTHYLKNFSGKNIGKSVTGLGLTNKEFHNNSYYFVFSPLCNHCRKAIPLVNSMIDKHEIKLVGIIADKMQSDLIQLKSEIKIDFNVISVDDKIFQKLARLVPVIYEAENDTIVRTYLPKFLPVNILSKNRINLSTHFPF